MPDRCVVVGCSNTYKTHKMFSFPHAMNEPEKRNVWIKNVNRQGWIPGDHSFVCSKHFEDGKPTELNPYPTMEMGWNCSLKKGRKRPLDRKKLGETVDSKSTVPESTAKGMPLKKSCIVPNCQSFNVPTFAFPRLADVRAEWAIAVGLRPESIGTFARICLKHFKEDDFIKLSKRLSLRHDAVPFVKKSSLSSSNDEWFEFTDKRREKNSKSKNRAGKIVKKSKKVRKSSPKSAGKEKLKLGKGTKIVVASRSVAPLPEKVVDTPDVQNTTVLDKDYYFVLINKHKKDIEVLNSSEHDEISSSETQKNANPNVPYFSINEILNEAMKISSSVDETNLNLLNGLKMPDCFNPDCRQLAGRVFLLQKEKEKLRNVYDELRREVESYEASSSSSDVVEKIEEEKSREKTTTKRICPSCVDGRLSNMYKTNAIRVNKLTQKLNEIRRENIILTQQLNARVSTLTNEEEERLAEEEAKHEITVDDEEEEEIVAN